MRSLPLIEVLVITYNHEKFINQALNSILSQVCEYPIKITIYDDCSNDNNAQVILETMKNVNANWNFHHSNINQLSNGMSYFSNLLKNLEGDLIAILDGDDYWIDNSKLQLQATALIENSQTSICHHSVAIIEDGVKIGSNPSIEFRKEIVKGIELAKDNFISTPSVMFKREFLPTNFGETFNSLSMGDYPLWALISDKKEVVYIDREMAVYRKHTDSYWSKRNAIDQAKQVIFAKAYLAGVVSEESRDAWIEGIILSSLKINHERYLESMDSAIQTRNYLQSKLTKLIKKVLRTFFIIR